MDAPETKGAGKPADVEPAQGAGDKARGDEGGLEFVPSKHADAGLRKLAETNGDWSKLTGKQARAVGVFLHKVMEGLVGRLASAGWERVGREAITAAKVAEWRKAGKRLVLLESHIPKSGRKPRLDLAEIDFGKGRISLIDYVPTSDAAHLAKTRDTATSWLSSPACRRPPWTWSTSRQASWSTNLHCPDRRLITCWRERSAREFGVARERTLDRSRLRVRRARTAARFEPAPVGAPARRRTARPNGVRNSAPVLLAHYARSGVSRRDAECAVGRAAQARRSDSCRVDEAAPRRGGHDERESPVAHSRGPHVRHPP